MGHSPEEVERITRMASVYGGRIYGGGIESAWFESEKEEVVAEVVAT